ncbi:MAG: hypothetical protein N2322_06895, partial [Terrimicrobiaceae bacterium]|nr:hypothetical protein [Terrimicrobiaceae bacterium]
ALGVQALGALCVTGSAFLASLAAFRVIDAVIGLRAADEEQDLGLDFTEHSASAYADFLTTEQTLEARPRQHV